MSNTDYEAANISVLEGLEAVRKRPGMYIGNTGSDGLHRCLGEIFDNSVDEFMAGHATTVKVHLSPEGWLFIGDDGRGIPTDIHPKTGKSALETIMTVLHAGGKFDQKNYKFSGGLHGVGASVVNALSEKMQVWVLRNKEYVYQEFQKGKTVGNLEKMTKDDFKTNFPELKDKTVWQKNGTVIAFKPDNTIFEATDFNLNQLETYLKNSAYLNKGLKIIFEKPNKENPEKIDSVEYNYPQGIVTYIEDLTAKEKTLLPVTFFEGEMEGYYLELAFTYTEGIKEKLYPFTNGIINPEGGMHVTGFRTAFTKCLNNYAINKNIFKKDERLTSDDIKEGLRAVLSIKMVDPQFTSQSKVKLGSTKARKYTDNIISEKLEIFLEENPRLATEVISKALLAMKARMAARAARESVLRKGVLDSLSLPGKLADCSSKIPEESEIFIVEGDSAGGSAKQARDRHTQAILPLRGKVLNTEKAQLDKVMNYEAVKNMIVAFGTGIGEQFDISKLRYHKIVLMTDADVDGAHITTLLLTFFYRYMPKLIEEGYVYMAQPPLYKLSSGKSKLAYVYSDNERDEIMQSWKSEKPDIKIEIQRYKGLGEMNPDQLWETTMDPTVRFLGQVTIGEAALANKIFSDLMGADVAPRREFIEENAMFVKELDLV